MKATCSARHRPNDLAHIALFTRPMNFGGITCSRSSYYYSHISHVLKKKLLLFLCFFGFFFFIFLVSQTHLKILGLVVPVAGGPDVPGPPAPVRDLARCLRSGDTAVDREEPFSHELLAKFVRHNRTSLIFLYNSTIFISILPYSANFSPHNWTALSIHRIFPIFFHRTFSHRALTPCARHSLLLFFYFYFLLFSLSLSVLTCGGKEKKKTKKILPPESQWGTHPPAWAVATLGVGFYMDTIFKIKKKTTPKIQFFFFLHNLKNFFYSTLCNYSTMIKSERCENLFFFFISNTNSHYIKFNERWCEKARPYGKIAQRALTFSHTEFHSIPTVLVFLFGINTHTHTHMHAVWREREKTWIFSDVRMRSWACRQTILRGVKRTWWVESFEYREREREREGKTASFFFILNFLRAIRLKKKMLSWLKVVM